jgi:glycosyltransferase involved in cell wall biosynthesis
LLGWPVFFIADSVTDGGLQAALEYCLTEDAHKEAVRCADRAAAIVQHMATGFIEALRQPGQWEVGYLARTTVLVSVIIPCYNQACFLVDAIGSVLAQTYRHIEIIVVDDGSQDDTAGVVANYAMVRYIRQDNQGLSGARNTGTRESRGAYLVFLDADDRLEPDALQLGLNCLHTHPECAFVSGHYRFIDDAGKVLAEHPQPPLEDDPYQAMLCGNYIGMHATVMYQRKALDSVGGFNTTLRSCEDYDMYLRITRCWPVHRHPFVVAEYRRHESNMSHDFPQMLRAALSALTFQWEHIRSMPRYSAAYRAGIRFWLVHFSKRLIRRFIILLSARQWVQLGRLLGGLPRYLLLCLASIAMQILSPDVFLLLWRSSSRVSAAVDTDHG